MKEFIVKAGEESFNIGIESDGTVVVNGTPSEMSIELSSNGKYRILFNRQVYDVFCKKTPSTSYDVWLKELVIPVTIEDLQTQLLSQYQKAAEDGHTKISVRAPMPGLVTNVNVAVGQLVEKNMRLLTLEAMKMENEIHSPMQGRITRVEVEKNSKVEKDQNLIVIEAE